MATKIIDIEGIGPVFAEKLTAAGIHTDADMLARAASAKGRADLAEATGIAGGLILKWANHCDLMRIVGVGPQFAELLEASGVDTVKELAQRNAANLAAKMAEINKARNVAGTTPSETHTAEWISQAKALPPALSY